MGADEDDGDDDEVIITVPADMQAGVWANWAAINESDVAFVLTRDGLEVRRRAEMYGSEN